eukprot:scaffold35470_cov51-Phaeocystis_antarctica.AAC.1
MEVAEEEVVEVVEEEVVEVAEEEAVEKEEVEAERCDLAVCGRSTARVAPRATWRGCSCCLRSRRLEHVVVAYDHSGQRAGAQPAQRGARRGAPADARTFR